MNQANRVAKNTLILYSQMAITVVFSLYTTRLVLASLGASDFGIFNVLGGAIMMFMFLSSAMEYASQRYMSFFSGEGDILKQRQIFNASLKMHIIIGFLTVLILEFVGLFLFDGILNIDDDRIVTAQFIYQFLIISTFFNIISVPYNAVVNAHENMLFVALTRIFEVILKFLIAAIITYISKDKLFTYGLLMALVPVLLFFVRQIYGHYKYDEVVINFGKYHEKSLFKEMSNFAGWSFVGASSSLITNYGQGIVINIFFGTAVNAAQAISTQVSGQLGAFSGTMLRALNPVIAKSEGAGDRKLMLKASLTGNKFAFYLLILFLIPAMAEMSYLFKIWLKVVPEYAIIFCYLLLVRNLIEQLFYTLDSSIAAVGDIKSYQIINSVLNFLPLFVSYFFFKAGFDAQAIYFIFICYSLAKSVVVLYFSKIKCGLSVGYYFREVIIPCVIVFVIVYFLVLVPGYLMEEGLYRLLVVVIVNICSFFVFVWNLGLSNDEKLIFRKIIKSLLSKTKNIRYRL